MTKRSEAAPTNQRWCALVCFLLSFVAWSGTVSCQGDRRSTLRIAATTSTASSGVVDILVDAFEEETGIRTQVIIAGTGQALELGERGDVDLVLVHARAREDAFVESGAGIDRRDIMWNDFVITGPPSDPARIRGLTDAPIALRKIARSGSTFISRGDDSGTHIREKSLWAEARFNPESKPWYSSVGQGMGRSLLIAAEKQAYVLVDRGTWLAFSDRTDLPVLVQGDPTLRNPYGAIRVNPKRHPDTRHENARRFQDFLTSPEGQRLISEFRVNGQPLFHPHRKDG